MINEPQWEYYGANLVRIKVDGGWLFSGDEVASPLTYVPDVDLTRYQSHLRDAYDKGFADGLEERKAYERQYSPPTTL